MKNEISYIPIKTKYEQETATLGDLFSLVEKLKELYKKEDKPQKIIQLNEKE